MSFLGADETDWMKTRRTKKKKKKKKKKREKNRRAKHHQPRVKLVLRPSIAPAV